MIVLILFTLNGYSQQNLKNIRTRSWNAVIYKITATEAEQFIKWDSIPLSRFENTPPVITTLADAVDTDTLPLGHYVEIRVVDNVVEASLFNNTSLQVLTINNKNNLQLDVRSKAGPLQTSATVFLKGRALPFNSESKTFWVKQHRLDEAIVKICTPGDTTFIELAELDKENRSISEQRRNNYHHTTIYKILSWLPSKMKQFFSHRRKYNSNRIGAQGYIIFNQPKYKPLDTVKFKGYVVDKKWKQYDKPIHVYLSYYGRGKQVNQLVQVIKPVSGGAYTGEFVLADTIPSDITCSLYFKTGSSKEIIRSNFKLEDYVLDEMGTFTFSSDKETVYKNDSMIFTASAKDANGLQVMDATATLVITTAAVNKFYKDTVFIADTLYSEEKKLLTIGDTKFWFFTKKLPLADISLNAKLVFKSSNNEMHEEHKTFNYVYEAASITITQDKDSIKALLFVNGKAVTTAGEVEMNDGLSQKIQFPYGAKIDPVASGYTFYYTDAATGKIISKSFDIEENYRIDFTSTSRQDTLGFIIGNPYKIPVYYTVFFGKQIIAAGKESNGIITWQKKMNNHRRSYKVRWQYIWGGEERQGEENIGLFYKLLDIKIKTGETVFPGQKDAVKITVKDYLGNPAENVNLTAVSYNNQFNKSIRVPQPPYLARYKSKKYLQYEGFENDGEVLLSKKYLLGKNKQWINTFHLDTMVYYKLLFPTSTFYDAVTLTENVIPQLSVNMVQKGVPQEIYLLYINNRLVYYNGVTDKMPYSFETMPENVKLGIRLKDKFIEIDSLYIQPHYKHDLSFDLDNLPRHTTVAATEKYWSNAEMNLLENSLWQMKNDYYNNYSYLWQYGKLVKLSGNRQHIVGPLNAFGQTTFFNPGSFDIQFAFEPGYEYSLSRQVARLEKKPVFPRRDINNYLLQYSAVLQLGDTLAEPPAIVFTEKKQSPFLRLSKDAYNYQYYAAHANGTGRLQFTLPKDTAIRYIVLQLQNQNAEPLVLPNDYGYSNKVNNLAPGSYSVYFVTAAFYTAALEQVNIQKDGITCVKINEALFKTDNAFINELQKEAEGPLELVKDDLVKTDSIFKATVGSISTTGGGRIFSGKVVDARGGNPVPFATVRLKGSSIGLSCDANGNFSIKIPAIKTPILQISAAGYKLSEVAVDINGTGNKIFTIILEGGQYLKEVVVTGAFGIKRMAMTGSVVTVTGKDLSFGNELAGKVSGVMIRTVAESRLGAETTVRLRGENGLGTGEEILYVIDGILYDKTPANFNPENIADISVLQGPAGAALYGARGMNGVIVITTKTQTLRTTFRDYAFWQPNFFTDRNGEASFDVQYPDNITGWRTFVVGMDKKRRMGKATVLTQAYKPIVAQLALPQFLLEGDTAVILGKAKNYTPDAYNISTGFTINGAAKNTQTKEMPANEAATDEQQVKGTGDTVTVKYGLQTTTGFNDGEVKKIPVFKKGIEETEGAFWILQKDTAVQYKLSPYTKDITIHAENNTLEVLLSEMEHLKQYPYYCMEQTASKLTGYDMERKVKQQLQQSFTNEKEMNRLLAKLQKAQQFDGGWAWWENGKSNFYITNYIANALLPFRENVLVETNIRNAFLYLQNQLPYLQKNELLAALVTLNNGKHVMNYGQWLNRIAYDSLSQHQQWQWVKIMQGQHLPYFLQLQKLLDKQIGTMLGGVHWGDDSYSWYSNSIATTVLAFEVLKNENKYQHLLPKIIQYFLERRKSGYWRNTVESATILSAILPTILQEQTGFTDKAVINIGGDTAIKITSYPRSIAMNNTQVKNMSITKTGGGMVYFTIYEKRFNPMPLPADSNFKLTTYFEKDGQALTAIRAGEKIVMKIKLEVNADAQYVMLQVPIPAGCTYAAKKTDWNTYREFYKDKMMLFTEELSKGTHYFEVELEPRYKGTYTINPAKAELMYFPTFYGRNETKVIKIRE